MLSIKTLRKEKGLSQKELAELCGCSPSTIYRMEIGATFYSNLDSDTRKRIAEVLGFDEKDFYHNSTKFIFQCRTWKVQKDELEKMLKEKYGDKIGAIRGKRGKVKRTEAEKIIDEFYHGHWERVR